MIPESLVKLIEAQSDNIHRTRKDLAIAALKELGVSLDSEFAELFIEYKPANFKSAVSDEYICDIAEPTPQIMAGTEFIHEMWELPENYICFTSLQGEGGYLFDKHSGMVWDFALSQYDDFISGKIPPKWKGFFEFVTWYLSPVN